MAENIRIVDSSGKKEWKFLGTLSLSCGNVVDALGGGTLEDEEEYALLRSTKLEAGKRYTLTKVAPAGAVATPLPVDRTIDVAAQLFAAFNFDGFPARLHRSELMQLLSAPLPVKVPVPGSLYPRYEELYPGLFEPSDSSTAVVLADRLAEALRKPWPRGEPPSELMYTPFWDAVGYGLPEFASGLLQFDAVVTRNVVDSSISLPDNKRDYMVHLLKRMVIGGEDKVSRNLMPSAVKELRSKHKGANAALYGGLGYLILIATAGDRCAVYAMELGNDALLTPIIDEFEMKTLLGRRKVVSLFINLTRWVRTVDAMNLLPPPPPAALAVPFSRPSPYPNMGQVELSLHFKHVTKSFAVPIDHLPDLLDVYTTLAELRMPDVIRCRSLKVAGTVMDLSNNTMRILPQGQSSCHVVLELEPVGACFTITDETELRSLVVSLLSTLCRLHEAGYVHRDIRVDNIVKYFQQWVLIDWELAGRVDQDVWWEGSALPEPVRLHQRPYTVKTDLWQVGKLMMTQQVVASREAKLFAQKLVNGDFQSAAQAEGGIWAIS
ncbi:probable crinkler effector protein 8 [Coccomyxa sp. Obi]|nr:probable crinkler effector protein 8 [Coccomyxa sp. Obi]